jgi:hypothetical protein
LFRREITAEELRASLAAFDEDIAAGRWQRPNYALADVHDRAAQLSGRHATEIGCRTLDIYHVAAALVIGTPEFFSLDERRRELARREGLHIKP